MRSIREIKDRLIIELFDYINASNRGGVSSNRRIYKRCQRCLKIALWLSGTDYIEVEDYQNQNIKYITRTTIFTLSRFSLDGYGVGNASDDMFAKRLSKTLISGVMTHASHYMGASFIVSDIDAIRRYMNGFLNQIGQLISSTDPNVRYLVLSTMYGEVTTCQFYDEDGNRYLKSIIEDLVVSLMSESELKRCKMEAKLLNSSPIEEGRLSVTRSTYDTMSYMSCAPLEGSIIFPIGKRED